MAKNLGTCTRTYIPTCVHPFRQCEYPYTCCTFPVGTFIYFRKCTYFFVSHKGFSNKLYVLFIESKTENNKIHLSVADYNVNL